MEVQATSQGCPVPRLESWAHFCTCKSLTKERLNSQALQSVCHCGKFPVAWSRLLRESHRCGPLKAEHRRQGRREAQNQPKVSGEHWVEPLHCPPSTLALSLYPRSSRGWGEGIYLPKGKFIFTGDLWSLIVSSFLKITSKMRSYKLGTEVCPGRREGTELEALSSLICISHSPPPNRAAVCLLPAGWLRQPRNHKALAPHRLIASPGYQMD